VHYGLDSKKDVKAQRRMGQIVTFLKSRNPGVSTSLPNSIAPERALSGVDDSNLSPLVKKRFKYILSINLSFWFRMIEKLIEKYYSGKEDLMDPSLKEGNMCIFIIEIFNSYESFEPSLYSKPDKQRSH